MNIVETPIPGLAIIEPKLFKDSRGFFTELYNERAYGNLGIPARFVQDNLSRSARGVLRGLHIQNPNLQGKLVTVMRGVILDVAVDVRVGSPTFGRHVKVELSEENRRLFWLPRGFAHGFLVLSEYAEVLYKCDEFYSPGDEVAISWNDPQIGIDWGNDAPELSQRDRDGQNLADLDARLPTY